MRRSAVILLSIIAVVGVDMKAQVTRPASTPPPDSILARGLVFRGIGPSLMGGRISEIAVAKRGRLGTAIYIAAATGGIWRSTNAGVSWMSVSESVRVHRND